VRCVGVPILDSNHQALAAISLAGTTEQMPLDRVHSLVLVLKQKALDISQQLATAQNDFRPNASGQSIPSRAC
jgi:DNA-binding IclR family transcriptional regulator